MMENIEKVLERGEKIEVLVDKTDNLSKQAQVFQKMSEGGGVMGDRDSRKMVSG